MKKHLLLWLTMLILLFSNAVYVSASEESESNVVKSGTCGTDINYTFTDDGTLTIRGTGELPKIDDMKEYKDSVTNVIIEDGITGIQESVFYGWDNLVSVAMPESVTSIAREAFYECHNLEKINLPDGITSIGVMTFVRCEKLKNISLPKCLKKIEWDTFRDCSSLENIEIPESVISIESDAFLGCKNLHDIAIPNSVTFIGMWAFSDSGLTSIIIPDSVTDMESSVFSCCENLESVVYSKNLLEIPDSTFNCCHNLTNVTISGKLVSIGKSAFTECHKLKNISIPEVKYIGENAFVFCKELNSITIPNGIVTIYNNTFNGCDNLQNVTIPVSVKNIDMYAFADCDQLENIYYTGTEEQWKNVHINNKSGGNRILYMKTIHCLGTEQDIPQMTIESQIQLSEGNYADWIDRVTLPAFAQEFYDWLDESTDGDGNKDVLLDAANKGYGTYYYRKTFNVYEDNKENLIVRLKRELPAALDAIETTYNIFRHEHPEVTFLRPVYGTGYTDKYLSNVSGQIYIEFQVYLNKVVKEDYLDSIALQNSTVKNILSLMPSDLSRYEMVRFFNKYLTENNGYNSLYPDEPKSAHKAITALLGKSGEEGPVCDSYARAFKILCNAVNIPCAYVSGNADGTSHAWNMVQMEDGKWYAVDVTWNDPIVPGVTDKISGYENEGCLLIGSDTVVEGKTFGTSHIAANDNQVTNTFFEIPNGPVLNETEYIPSEPSVTLKNTSDILVAKIIAADKVTSQGIIYGKDDDVTLETPGRTRVAFSEIDEENAFTFDASMLKGYVIRAYITYTDENGEETIAYSEPIVQ